jgi:hypothetical protein
MAMIDFLGDSGPFQEELYRQPTQPTWSAPTTTTPTWTTQQATSRVPTGMTSQPVPGTPYPTPTVQPTTQQTGIQTAFGFPSWEEIMRRYQAHQQPQAPQPTQQTQTSGPAAFSGSGSFRDWFMQAIQGQPFNQQTLLNLEPLLGQSGSRLTPANAQGERTKIWDPTIQDWVRVGFGEGQPVWIPQGWGQNGPGFQSQFSDPSSAQLETFLQRYLGELDQQRGQQDGANADLRARQAQAQEATQRLIAFMQQRAQQLQGPAYTGAEQEVFRTQALDPIERDRQASHRRSLERTSARGMAPTSGLAELDAQNIDQSFDRLRAGSQNQLAYRQINEQRSREQEAQALLAAIPQTQRAAAQGDLGFLQALDAALNGYRDRGAQVATQQQQMGSLALRDALAAMGMAPSADNQFAQMMQMYQLQQQNSLPWWQALGSLLPMLG